MTNLEKYNNAFIETFGVDEAQLAELAFSDIPEWDSVGHMRLIVELEGIFDIMFETDDIINLDSYEKGKTFMNRYDVAL